MDQAQTRATRTGETPRPASSPGKVRGGGAAHLGNALDALRVAGTFLVLMYHASLSYLATPMRLTLWSAYDASSHVGMDVFAYWVNGFAMPLFFLAAGVSAPAGIESRGVRVFLKHRAGRLLRPLLFGTLTIIPVCYLACGYGLLETGQSRLDDLLNWRFEPHVQRQLYGVGHLWFLEYLFIVCVLWAGCWALGRRLGRIAGADGHGWLERLFGSAWRPLLLAVPTALIFLVDTDTLLRVENILAPNPSRLVHYLYFFAAGGWIARLEEPKERLIPHSRLYLALAAVDFVVMVPLLLRFASAPETLTVGERLVFVGLAAAFPWLFLLGSLGVCLRYLEGKGPTLRFLAEASFWVYLIHLPIVLIMQGLLLPLPWPALVKFLATAAVAAGASVWSYEYVARYSLVGEIVNGTRKRIRGQRRYGREFGWVAVLGVLALFVTGSVGYLRVFLWEDNFHAVAPGRVYRVGQLSINEFERVARRERLRSVIALSGDDVPHRWIALQEERCRAIGIAYRVVVLRDDRLPGREQVQELLRLLEASPKPILIQGDRGLDPCGFTAALALMLEGTPPATALGQFGRRYAQFGGPEHSALGVALLDYQSWLGARRLAHSPERLATWAEDEYLVRSTPTFPAGVRPGLGAGVGVASAARPSVAR